MSSSLPPADRYFLFDTGPLLCFAGIPRGYGMLAARYKDRAGVISDVHRELHGLANRTGPVGEAAKIAVSKYGWLESHQLTDVDDLKKVEATRHRLQTFKQHRKRVQDLEGNRKDWGECATLVLAEKFRAANRRQIVVVVANEDAARDLAEADGIPAICAADIFQALVDDGHLTANQAFQHCRKLDGDGFDLGAAVKAADYFK